MRMRVKGGTGGWRRRRWVARTWIALTWIAASLLALPAMAEEPEPDHPWRGKQLHAALLNGLPAVLGTGMSTGASLRWLQPLRQGQARWVWGTEISAGSATEYGASWQVSQLDLRLRAVVGAQAALGRGKMALLLGAGTTLVREDRLRNQGERLGLSGDALEQSSWGALGSLDLSWSLAAPVAGPWAAVVSAGPALHLGSSGAAMGWTTLLGVGWMP
jgi:hypothetical protein